MRRFLLLIFLAGCGSNGSPEFSLVDADSGPKGFRINQYESFVVTKLDDSPDHFIADFKIQNTSNETIENISIQLPWILTSSDRIIASDRVYRSSTQEGFVFNSDPGITLSWQESNPYVIPKLLLQVHLLPGQSRSMHAELRHFWILP